MSLRDAYRQKLAARVEEQRAKIGALKARAKRLAADSQIMTYEELGAAEKNLTRLTSKLRTLAGAGASALAEVKGGVGKAWEDLSSSTIRAAERIAKIEEREVGAAAGTRRVAAKTRAKVTAMKARKSAPKRRSASAKVSAAKQRRRTGIKKVRKA